MVFWKLLVLLLLIAVFSCTKQKNGVSLDDETIIAHTDLKDSNQSMSWSEFVDSVSFIKLETTDESLINKISQVYFCDSLIFINDIRSSKIFVFYNDGKFRNKISKLGQGPGEYLKTDKMLIDEQNKRIIIYDCGFRKLLFYSFDGQLIKEIKAFNQKNVIRDIINLPNGNFLCYTPDKQQEGKPFGIWEVDSLGKTVRWLYVQTNRYPFGFHQFGTYWYRVSDDEIGLWTPDENRIYHYKNGTLSVYLKFDLTGKTLEDYPNTTTSHENHNNIYHLIEIIEKRNIIYSFWIKGEKTYMAFFIKNENRMKVASPSCIDNTIHSLCGWDISINKNNKMLRVVYAEDLQQHLSIDTLSLKNIDMINSIPNLEDSNPILEVLHLKN
jgi:hypothetical protein